MNDISKNIRKVLTVFLLCFMAIIVYMSYFEVFVGPKIVNNPLNRRLWIKRNEVLRGTIYDRNMKPLTKSTRIDASTQKREYTGGEMFAHALGYCDIKYGITGLEQKYDGDLMANDDTNVDLFKLFDFTQKKKEKLGHNLQTTLDFDLQKAAFDALGDNRGAVVALNPSTGEILAMVSKPSFNPNSLQDIWKTINSDPKRPLLNRAVSGLYPPGSTFKTVTAVSALENISDIQSETFDDNGKLYLNATTSLSNFKGEVLGNLSFKDAYVHSSNVAFGTIGLKLGNDALKKTAEEFYFNKNIPCDGIIIDNGVFPQYKSYEKGNIAQSAIGQSGVLASPMEMALVASTIGNNGTMMKPFLVKQVTDSSNNVLKTISPETIGDVVSSSVCSTMKDLMRSVVERGTGTAADIEGLNVCGKTGTAQHTDEGKNSPDHSWFIAFAPQDNPKIAVSVIVEDGGQGGEAAANVAAKVLTNYLKR